MSTSHQSVDRGTVLKWPSSKLPVTAYDSEYGELLLPTDGLSMALDTIGHTMHLRICAAIKWIGHYSFESCHKLCNSLHKALSPFSRGKPAGFGLLVLLWQIVLDSASWAFSISHFICTHKDLAQMGGSNHSGHPHPSIRY